jgi:hypothetical protein
MGEDYRFEISDMPPQPHQLLDLPPKALGIILDFIDPTDRLGLMNTCRTASNMHVIKSSLIAPLAIRLRRSDYVSARDIIAPGSAGENDPFQTIQQIDDLSLMNTCSTTSNMNAIKPSLMAPLATRVRPSHYVRARDMIPPGSTGETYSIQTIEQVDMLLRDIARHTKDEERTYSLRKLLLAGQVSLLCLLDLHQRLHTSTQKPPTLPTFKVLGL